jgi:RNAse (barnase) inhibitor barstar
VLEAHCWVLQKNSVVRTEECSHDAFQSMFEMCCQKAFLKQNDILWDCIATSMKTAQYLVYSQLMESCFNSFDFLSFLPWCTELILHHRKCNNYLHMLQHCHRKLEWTKFSLCCMHACLESKCLTDLCSYKS